MFETRSDVLLKVALEILRNIKDGPYKDVLSEIVTCDGYKYDGFILIRDIEDELDEGKDDR